MEPITLCSPERVKINHKNVKIMHKEKKLVSFSTYLIFFITFDFPEITSVVVV